MLKKKKKQYEIFMIYTEIPNKIEIFLLVYNPRSRVTGVFVYFKNKINLNFHLILLLF